MMKFHDQHRPCHPERSEGSAHARDEILRCAQDDRATRSPISVVKIHHSKLNINCALARRIFLCIGLSLALFLSCSPSLALADGGFPIVGVLHAGRRPEALALDTQTHLLYIAFEAPGLLVCFDPISGKVRWHTMLGDAVTDVQVDSNRHLVYAGHPGRLSLLDGATGRVLATLPIGSGDNSIALDSQHGHVYVATPDSGTVNAWTFAPGSTTPTHAYRLHIGPRPNAIAVNSRLGRLYIADSKTNTLYVLNEDTNRTIATIPVAAFPLPPLRVDESTGRVFVVCSMGEELAVINGYTNNMIAHPAVAPSPEGIAIHTATGRIYVADEGNHEDSNSDQSTGNTITVLDGQSLAVLGALRVGAAPDGVEADPALYRIYVSLEDSNAVVEMSDSPNLPLNPDFTHEAFVARQTLFLLQQAQFVTLVLMLATIVGATLYALLPHWRARGSPQTAPGDESSHSERHSPPR